MTEEPGSEGLLSGPDPEPHDTDGSGVAWSDPPADQAGDADASGETGDATESAQSVQAMLTRAAEGQLEEQREVVNAVNELRAQVMRLSQELAEMRVHRGSDETSDAQLNSVTVEVREAVRFLNERLDGVTRMVAQRGEELADIRTALTAIDAHVRSQAETIGVLSSGLQVLPSYGERVSILHDNLVQMHRQIEGLETGITGLQDDKLGQRLAAVESSMSPMQGRLNEITDVETAQSALLSQLQSSASHLQGAVGEMHSRLEAVAEDLATLGGGLAGLADSVESVAAAEPQLAAGVDDSVSRAMNAAELRLMHHVDEAVYALAQTLLRRLSGDGRPGDVDGAGSASVVAETGVGSASIGELADEAALGEVDVVASAPADSAPTVDAPEWWEREMHGVGEAAAPATDDDTDVAAPIDDWSVPSPADTEPDVEPAGLEQADVDQADVDQADVDQADVEQMDEDDVDADAGEDDLEQDDADLEQLAPSALDDIPPEHWTFPAADEQADATAADDVETLDDDLDYPVDAAVADGADTATTSDEASSDVPSWWESSVVGTPDDQLSAETTPYAPPGDYEPTIGYEPATGFEAPAEADDALTAEAAPSQAAPTEAEPVEGEEGEEAEPWGTLPAPAERDPAAITAWATEEDAPLEGADDDAQPAEPWGTLPTPAERDPADPTVSLAQPAKKRHWWSR